MGFLKHSIIAFTLVSEKEQVDSMNDFNIVERIKTFIEDEARSCSMDFGCVTPDYIYRMWGGRVSLDEIMQGIAEIWKKGFLG